MKAKHTLITVGALFIALFFSCKKKFTEPAQHAVAAGPSITIDSLRKMYNYINIKFTSNTLLHGVVTMDESSGNIYKQVYIRDNSGSPVTHGYNAISLHFLSGSNGFLAVGDSIAINLKGVTLDMSSGGSLQLDSIRPTSSITKIKTGLNPVPIVVTLPQLSASVNIGANTYYAFDAHLVQINNVEFVTQNIGLPYATGQNPPAAPVSVNRFINDCNGNTMVTYNSGYANFAYSATNPITIPNNSGTITAIASVYNSMQLTLRSYPEINLTASYCPVVYDTITQNFKCGGLLNKSPIMTAGWKSFDIAGNLAWQGLQYGFPPIYGCSPSVSNYKTADVRNDVWLVSPPIIDHGGTPTKSIDFSSAITYPTSKKLLTILVSRTFDGTHIIPSQWTDISSYFPKINQTAPPPNFQYAHWNACSSNIFSPCPVPITVSGTSSTFYIAFRYQSSTAYAPGDSTGSTYVLGTLVLK